MKKLNLGDRFRRSSAIIRILIILLWMSIFFLISFSLSGCGNKQLLDTHYTFNYAIVQRADGEQLIRIKSWKDYEGEQLQITDVDGKTWLVSSYNTILCTENPSK